MMKTTEANYRRQLKTTAIALNNMAVTLLRNGCCRQAMYTLTDAIEIMKILSRESNLGRLPQELQNLHVHDKLQQAYRRSANPNPDQGTPGNYKVISSNHCPTSIECDPDTTSLTTILIQIEPFDLDYFSFDEVDVESSVILYNYGHVYRQLASSSNLCDDFIKVRMGAYRLFQSSHSVISSKLLVAEGSDDAKLSRLFLVSILSLKYLSQIAIEMEMSEIARFFSSQLAEVQASVSHLSYFEEICQYQGAPAA